MAKLSVVISSVLIVFLGFVTAKQPANTTNDGNSLTFTWYDGVTPERVKIAESDRNPSPKRHWAEEKPLYLELNGTYKLGATNFSAEFPDSISWTENAGFVETVFFGYQQHHNVIIRPDDVWTAILIQFSLYVNANSEALRHSFVNFEGKEELVVAFRSRIDRVDIREFIQKMSNLIEGNIDRGVYDWIMPNFTTTTTNDKLTAGAAMMATLQNYYDYELYGIICGIPKVTILGTVDDWEGIRKRVEKLSEFDLDGKNIMAQWTSMLTRILDNFVSVKKGNKPDDVFWEQAIRIDYKLYDFVCAKINETLLNGWLTTFSAFTLAGRWRGQDTVDLKENTTPLPWLKVRIDRLTPGIVHVPIKIYDEYAEEGERNYSGAIITGHMGYSVKKDRTTIQPFSGWIMMVTNDPPKYFERKDHSQI